MTHLFDMDKNDRWDIAKGSDEYISIEKSYHIYKVVYDAYPKIANGLVRPEIYHPTEETDEVEAAIFTTAWNLSAKTLFKRFGADSVVSLFARFSCVLIRSGLAGKQNQFRIFRGTDGSPEIPFKDAMSWTTSLPMAKKFALENGYISPTILSGQITKECVLMAIAEDEEGEVVVRPGSIDTIVSQPAFCLSR